MNLFNCIGRVTCYRNRKWSFKWTKDIGGSSDLIEVDKDSIWVTSSLYELDVEDYTETTLFEFNKNSKIIKSINFEEKPWFMTNEKEMI